MARSNHMLEPINPNKYIMVSYSDTDGDETVDALSTPKPVKGYGKGHNKFDQLKQSRDNRGVKK